MRESSFRGLTLSGWFVTCVVIVALLDAPSTANPVTAISNCVPYAYGDFNADKLVDIFCVSDDGHQVTVLLAQDQDPMFFNFTSFRLLTSPLVVNIVPGDFNGDSVMDLLFISQTEQGANYKASLMLGNKSSRSSITISPQAEIVFDMQLLDQPLVVDMNGDGKLDLLVEVSSSVGPAVQRVVYEFDSRGNISSATQLPFGRELFKGYAHSITDLDQDFNKDVVLTTRASDGDPSMYFEVLQINANTNQYEKRMEYAAPVAAHYGQSVFADFDSDGQMDHLLPLCVDKDCDTSAIYIYKIANKTWIDLKVDFKSSYGFIPASQVTDFWGPDTFSLKVGDYNLDGYQDLLAVLRWNNKNDSSTGPNGLRQYGFVLLNGQSEDPQSTGFRRTFVLDEAMEFENVVQASFFDVGDDGYLDTMLVTREDTTHSTSGAYQLKSKKNKHNEDAYFLKVMVLPGTCAVSQCPFQSLPYGLNYYGAFVQVLSTSFAYEKTIFYACQLSQSSHQALQLPYVVFGLGGQANFVDSLTAGMSSLTTGKAIRVFSQTWEKIIPNSQLVINPNPRDNKHSWTMQLFITPSKYIQSTLIALFSTMICLVLIIGVLQWRERKMDEKEKKIESQRFHFDGL